MQHKILSIDGGGTRGIIPATILDCISKDYNKEPIELFDLFAGTSTGGIICIAIAAGIPISKIVSLYLDNAKDIFHESWLDRLQGLDEHLQANYSNKRFKKILDELLGNKTLKDLHLSAKFGKRNKNLMVTSFDLNPEDENDHNKNYRPAVLHSEFIRDAHIKLSDLALMTSAGPTYFPVYAQQYIDGGVALNNPAMAAISFAINKSTSGQNYRYPSGKAKGLGLPVDNLSLFSLSTGTSNKSRIEKNKVKAGNWGSIQWIKYLPDLITETNMQSTNYYVNQVLEKEQCMRIELYFDAPDAPNVLKNNPKGVGMDTKDKESLLAMHEYAKRIYQQRKSHIAAFLGL